MTYQDMRRANNELRAAQKRALQLENYVIDAVSGCWVWGGGRSPDGYGKVKRNGRTVRAHRLFYEEFCGDIPDGLWVLHSCDNPACVNPGHLFVGTQADNEYDKDVKQRRPPSPSITHPERLPRGELHHKAKLSEQDVTRIRLSGETSSKLALDLGVSRSTILRVKNGTIWAHSYSQVLTP